MRHRKLNKRLGRNKSQRKMLLSSLVRSLFISHSIKTTVDKAKAARRLAEKIITLGKKGKLSDIRRIESILQDRALVSKIVKKISILSKDRKGGYTRIIRADFRKGDGAELAILEFTDMPVVEKKSKKFKKAKAEKTTGQAQQAEEKKPMDEPKEPKEELKKQKVEVSKDKQPSKQPDKVKKDKEPKVVKKEEPKKQEKQVPKKPQDDKKGFFGKFKGFFKKDK